MFPIFEMIEDLGHEQVVFCSHKESGLKAIIGIHNTTLGPALGGCRMWTYANGDEALVDVLRLSKGMTYKASVAGLNLGGGKAVIIGDPRTQKSEALFRAFGRFVEGLSGRYITAEDVGTNVKDMEYVMMETRNVTGIPQELGGSGDPSPVTAYGTYVGMKACAKEVYGSDLLEDKKVVIQGAGGNVGRHLCEYLNKEGAKLFVSDIYEEKLKPLVDDFGATIIPVDDVYSYEADIFSPAALGAVLNDDTIPQLKVKIVAGAANNQLKNEDKHGAMLKEMGILYAPDYVINSGGLINVYNELEGYNRDRALKQTAGIYDIMSNIIQIAKDQDIPTHMASREIAEKRIESISSAKKVRVYRDLNLFKLRNL
ncbi:MAG: Glu/Leu/Phe/Val dehydrogenase [Ignavibacteriae bacterium]|nr:Glu/Leu/Phe/Val dehydrogenase [Ignavibacteriota bacterium]MCB9243413.1 Glu/Leu/Phe/Val dehydrogenase [Ignavibacteriales bacterium]